MGYKSLPAKHPDHKTFHDLLMASEVTKRMIRDLPGHGLYESFRVYQVREHESSIRVDVSLRDLQPNGTTRGSEPNQGHRLRWKSHSIQHGQVYDLDAHRTA